MLHVKADHRTGKKMGQCGLFGSAARRKPLVSPKKKYTGSAPKATSDYSLHSARNGLRLADWRKRKPERKSARHIPGTSQLECTPECEQAQLKLLLQRKSHLH
ncbi:hypothetical protein ILYODFUR_027958 [Ilyodon furcidens]|uniref:Uncharacterized protein n=1 Tax=Ilyodon furcidens TaxID=33524 RepID=A0ABV0SQL4_9TELE